MNNATMGKSIGETLREGRSRQRLTVSECAKRTHIAPHYIEAMEEERWDLMPSESHRLGFLRLYARFLGVSAEDILQSYKQSKQAPVSESAIETPRPIPKATSARAESRISMVPWPKLIVYAILCIGIAWGGYHAIRHFRSDQHMDLSWLRFRPQASRLVASKHDVLVQHIRVNAESDSWLRVVDNHEMIFEGILPAGATKEWSGPGPFHIKAGNVNAVAIYWNDQPVDIKSAAHGTVAELRLPPAPADQTKN